MLIVTVFRNIYVIKKKNDKQIKEKTLNKLIEEIYKLQTRRVARRFVRMLKSIKWSRDI